MKRRSIKKVEADLDAVLSQFIRLRDCDGLFGYGRCISCGKTISYQTSEAGHFIPRRSRAVRWDERNVNAQCYECNRNQDQREVLVKYQVNLKGLIGDTGIDSLHAMKHDHGPTREQKETMLAEYRQKVRDMGGTA